MKNKKILFTTEQVDDDMFASATLNVCETFKDGVQFDLLTQRLGKVSFTLYSEGIEELNKFLTKWLEENK